jgi:hypothetical protein
MHSHDKRTPDRNRPCVMCGRCDCETVEHRIAGISASLCHLCHERIATRCAPETAPIWMPPDDLETIAQALLVEADFLSTLARSRWVLAYFLLERVRRDAPTADGSEIPDQPEV